MEAAPHFVWSAVCVSHRDGFSRTCHGNSVFVKLRLEYMKGFLIFVKAHRWPQVFGTSPWPNAASWLYRP
jgi:hypothetical protein